jgi:glutathione S-transferase
MITVHAAWNFAPPLKGIVRDLRAFWALEELGLPYDILWVDMSKAENKAEANRSVNPFGKIPALTDGALKLFESGAIVHYLYAKAGRIPADAGTHALLLQWMFASLNTMEPPFQDILSWDMFWGERPGREVRYPESIANAKLRLGELGAALGAKPYLLGDAFSPADIMMTTSLTFGQHKPDVFEGAPAITAYLARCKARPAYQRAYAKQGQGPGAQAA